MKEMEDYLEAFKEVMDHNILEFNYHLSKKNLLKITDLEDYINTINDCICLIEKYQKIPSKLIFSAFNIKYDNRYDLLNKESKEEFSYDLKLHLFDLEELVQEYHALKQEIEDNLDLQPLRGWAYDNRIIPISNDFVLLITRKDNSCFILEGDRSEGDIMPAEYEDDECPYADWEEVIYSIENDWLDWDVYLLEGAKDYSIDSVRHVAEEKYFPIFTIEED